MQVNDPPEGLRSPSRDPYDDPVSESVLEVRGIAKAFGSRSVLESVDFACRAGAISGIVGENGSGKTTLFRILMGVVRADAGAAFLDGRSLLPLPLTRKAEAGLGYLPQDRASFPELTVEENLAALLEILPIPRSERRARLEELTGTCRLGEVARQRYRNLSGGEQRRVEIAKILALRPRFLLLDEPFSGLDPRIVEDLTALFRRLVAGGAGILVTDHNVHVMMSFTERIHVLAGGRIAFAGVPAEVAANSAARALYLGEGFAMPS